MPGKLVTKALTYSISPTASQRYIHHFIYLHQQIESVAEAVTHLV